MGLKKILVVDDDPEVRLALQVRLTANHYDVMLAEDGLRAVAQAEKHRPDVMLLDLGLPVEDGFTVLGRLKANEDLSYIPVIVISGRDRAGNSDRVLKAGAKTFLQKPVSDDKLLAAVRSLLD